MARMNKAYDEMAEIISYEDEDRVNGYIVRVSRDVANGDEEAIIRVLLLGMIAEYQLKDYE